MRIDKNATITTLNSENNKLDLALTKNLSQISNLESAMLDPRCAGKAYSAMADRIRNLRIPVAKTHNVVFEAILGANQQNISEISSLPETSSGVLDTDECDRMIGELESQNRQFQYRQGALDKDSTSFRLNFWGYHNLIDVNNGAIAELRSKKDAATRYAAKSSSLYDSAKQSVSDLLQKSTNSINSYLNAGTYGDTSWTKDLSKKYKDSVMKQYDRYMIKMSLEYPDDAFLSDDNKFIYYNGKKWAIDGPLNEIPDLGTPDSPVMSAGYKTVDTKTITIHRFNLGMFLAGMGKNAEGGKPDCDARLKYSDKAATQWTFGSFVADAVGNTLGSFEKYEFTLVFKENGSGGQRVSLYSKDAKYTDHTWVGRNPMWGKTISAEAYKAVTGKDTSLFRNYDVVCKFDPERKKEDSYTKYHYFTEEGKMESKFIQYPKDKVVIKVDFGQTEVVDVTDWYFNGKPGLVDKSIAEEIKEGLSNNG